MKNDSFNERAIEINIKDYENAVNLRNKAAWCFTVQKEKVVKNYITEEYTHEHWNNGPDQDVSE